MDDIREGMSHGQLSHSSVDNADATPKSSQTHTSTRATAAAASRQRKRYLAACQPCHQRKTKCDVTVRGQPCSGCTTHGLRLRDCVVGVNRRAKNPPKIPHPVHPGHFSHSLHGAGEVGSNSSSDRDRSGLLDPAEVELPGTTEGRCVGHQHYSDLDAAPTSLSIGLEHPSRVVEQCSFTSNQVSDLYSIRDTVGHGHTYNITLQNELGSSINHQFTQRRTIKDRLCSEDFIYLKSKGALTFPDGKVCDDLVKNYFLQVHPWLPVLNAKEFLSHYINGGLVKLSPLLTWSVFLAASSFVSQETITRAGFNNRSEMRQAYFQYSKLLYDINAEYDRMSIIQSVILMAHWHQSDDDDLSGSWHWLGIAISLCQGLGLHRIPKPGDNIGSVLWRRIWWACVARDCWLALGYGRPLRISQLDKMGPLLSLDDFLSDLKDLPTELRECYIPKEINTLFSYYVSLLELSLVLGHVLIGRHSPQIPLAKVEEWDAHLSKIDAQSKYIASQSEWTYTDVVKLAGYHFEICYVGAYIALWRPYLFEVPVELSAMQRQLWHSSVQRKMREATTRSNSALENTAGMDMVRSLKQWTLTALIPMMQFYLIEMVCSKPLMRRLAKRKFDNCILVLGEMQETYWQTESISLFFRRVLQQITTQQEENIHGRIDAVPLTDSGGSITSSTAPVPIPNLALPLPEWVALADPQTNLEALGVAMSADSYATAELPWDISQVWDDLTWPMSGQHWPEVENMSELRDHF